MSAARRLLAVATLWPALAAATENLADLQTRYQSAAEFLFWNLEEHVSGISIEPRWLKNGRTFWYRRGAGIHLVDPTLRRETRLDQAPDGVEASPQATEVNPSPDGRWGVRVGEGNLFGISSADGRSHQWTTDGSADYAYALPPDSDLEHLARRRLGKPESPQGVWSRDGRRFLTYHVDQREVPQLPMVLSVQPGREHQIPSAYLPRIPLAGAVKVPTAQLVVFDVETGKRTDLAVPPLMMLFAPMPPGGIGWSADGSRVFAVHQSRDFRTQTLFEVDSRAGKARAVITETSTLPSRQFVNGDEAPTFTRIADGDEVVVRSIRDGWPHLYLYDGKTGALKNRLTRGEWAVREIKWIDEARRELYFTAGGREVGRDPYYDHLYRVGLDGSRLELLTPEDASHEIRFAPSGRYFIDTYSTVAKPPVIRLRAADGRPLMTLRPAELSYLKERNWVAPRREQLWAADGTTKIWATLFFPPHFDPRGSYPLVEVIYAGPQVALAPVRFLEGPHPAIPLTRLGFMVAVVDGRGSALRSQAFQDVSFGRGFGDEAIVADHVGAIRQLAQRYPAIDLARIGIYGHSWGGYRAARAMLQFPDFYRVGVASAGSHDNAVALFDSDRWLGMPQDDPLSDRLQSNLPLVGRLRGSLFLVHGEADEIVHPSNTLQLAEALIRANRSFDLLIYPGRGHADLKYAGYFNRRVFDYFVAHLLGLDPPTGVRIADRAD